MLIAMDGVPPVLVDLATFGLAYLGGYVALNPPRDIDRRLKHVYVFSFAILFVIGMGANIWQRSIDSNKQDKLKQDQTEAEERFSEDLRAVKGSSDAILSFVANPPAGMTREQVASVVRQFVESGKNNFSDVLGVRLIEDAKYSVSEVHGLAAEWAQHLHDMDAATHDLIMFHKPRTAASCPTPATPGCDTSMDPKDIPAFTKMREQEKAKFSREVRKKASGAMIRLCGLRTEIITNRLETWRSSVFSSGPTSELCAHIATVDYGPVDMSKAAIELDQIEKEFAATMQH